MNLKSGIGNKKNLNTTLIKIRKISPLSPISPVSGNYEEKMIKSIGDIEKTGDNTSTEFVTPPVNDDQNNAQISSDID